MLPILGSNVHYALFEPADEVLEDLLELYLSEAIEKLELRIQASSISVEIDEHMVAVSVRYVLTGTNM